MADDEKPVADQVQPTAAEAEEAGEQEMDAQFEQTAGGKAPEGEKKPDAKPEGGDKKLGADGKPVDEPKLGPDGKPIEAKAEPELTEVQKNLAERAKKFEAPAGGDQKPPDQKPLEQKPPEKKSDAAQAAPIPADVEALLKIPGVSEAKVHIDGAEATMGEFAKQYPEIVEAGLVIAKAIAQSQTADAIKGAGLDGFAKADSIKALETKVAQSELLVQVMAEHPDCVKIAKTPEWAEFIKSLPPGQQKMEESMDPADAIALLDAFKEQAANKSGQKAKDKAKESKAKKDALHTNTLSGDQKPSGEGARAGDDDEFEAEFDKTAGAKKG